MIRNAPPPSKIVSSFLSKSDPKNFKEFSILVEEDEEKKQVLLSPDAGICTTCQEELLAKKNRRYRYPFITCAQCGPRYSIIQHLPYERQGTTMQPFIMCEDCSNEYEDAANRRFFSQTNSCANCGVKMSLWENATSLLFNDTEKVFQHIQTLLQQGKILAVKGIGGYLLMCDANNSNTIQLLRSRKHRPNKPFALLYPDMETVTAQFKVNAGEKKLLQSAERPIVLVKPLPSAFHHLRVSDIAPNLKRLGIMLPCSPLLAMISADFAMPIVATSANISGSPIIYKDDDALAYLFELADYIVTYDREIVIPLDDSVVQVAGQHQHTIMLRRARGYAPSYLHYQPQTNACVLSMGAHLKSSFSLSINGNVFVSQFLGSGESFESQQMYKNTLAHWWQLYQVQPQVILADLHPAYFSHQYALELAAQHRAEVQFIQHHEAHFAAVLAENNLMKSGEAVLGVIWDGTGLGTDRNIWGGEFFKYEKNEMSRQFHFDYFPSIAGNQLALQPRIAALCALGETGKTSKKVKEKFNDAEWNNYQALMQHARVFTSSVGRLFDAVASLLDLCDIQSYEGEAAMQLQVLAEEYVDTNGFKMNNSYFPRELPLSRIRTSFLMEAILQDMETGCAKNYIAAKFHYSLVCLIGTVATQMRTEKICFSGGVFQNVLLREWIEKEYTANYQLYFHLHLSPNDENISFGQLAYYNHHISTAKKAE